MSLCLAGTAAATKAWIVTFLPGEEIWTRYGHIGLQVADEEHQRDVIYSYGHAPFNRPGFIFRYLRGEAYFHGKAQSWERVLNRYRKENRTIQRQQLNLTAAQTDNLLARLELSVDPQYRKYRYDQHRDNCSTRVRDILDAVTGGALLSAAALHTSGKSYRDFTLEAGAGRWDALIGLDFISGPTMDKPIDGTEAMFLPVNVRDLAAEALNSSIGGEAPLTGPIEEIYRRSAPPPQHGSPLAGRAAVAAAGAALGLALLLSGHRRRGRMKECKTAASRSAGILLAIAGSILGFAGTSIWALVAVSRVPDFAWNENIFLFWPFDFIPAVSGIYLAFTGRPAKPGFVGHYLSLRLTVITLYILLKTTGIFPQDNWAFIFASSAMLTGTAFGFRGAAKHAPLFLPENTVS